MAGRPIKFALALILLGSAWAAGYAQRSEPEFMLSIDAPAGETRIDCVSGCQLIGARDVGVPSAAPMKSYTFACTDPHRCKGAAGGWMVKASKASAERPQTPTAMTVVPIEVAKFAPVIARLPDGPQMAVLRGDPDTGPSAILLEMSRGAGPMHIHTADYHLVVIEGTMKHWAAGEHESDAKPLRPGSYWFQPGGLAHADACLSDKCVMQVVWSGPRDGRLAEPPKP